MSLSNIVRYSALILLPIVIFLLLAEFVLRWYLQSHTFYDVEMTRYAQEFKTESSNPSIGHIHIPGVRGRLMDVDVQINQDGLRDKEYSRLRSPDTRRLVFLGDSLTFGWGVEESLMFANLLEQELNTESATEVINFGTGNYNTVQQTHLFLEKGLAYKPDTVVIFYFINDAELLPKKSLWSFMGNFRIATFYWSRMKQVYARFRPGKTFRQFYADLYREDQVGWTMTKEAIELLARVCRENNITLRAVILPEFHDLVDYPFTEQHKLVLDVFRKNGVEVLDLAPKMVDQKDPYSLWVAKDDAHPNALAHRIIAGHSLDFIRAGVSND